jgi:hypothetical protein
MHLVDDFVWENYQSWNGSDACYKKLNDWIKNTVKKYPRSDLISYARMKEQEQIFMLDKLAAIKCSYECQDSFTKFISQRNQLRHLYMIIGSYAYVSTDIVSIKFKPVTCSPSRMVTYLAIQSDHLLIRQTCVSESDHLDMMDRMICSIMGLSCSV